MRLYILKRKIKTFSKSPIVLLKKIWMLFEPITTDEFYLKVSFLLNVGYWPNLKEPKSFNEKLQWLKLHHKCSGYTQMVDKVEAKKVVASIIGEKYIIPTIGVWDSVDEIDWNSLPSQFVIKAAHDSGGVVICKDITKLNIEYAKQLLRGTGKKDYTRFNKEYPYYKVPHRIIAEQYMVDESGIELKDYKFFCFNGEPKYVQIDFDRFQNHRRNIYDINWNLLDLKIKFSKGHDRVFPKPENYEEMINVSRRLSQGIPHVRVDLYNVNGKIYFGEMTFFHGSGMEQFTPLKWDYIFGDNLILPITQ